MWLEEDVAYIITDAERGAFLTLNSNEEREQFIEQFWLRRDPTPNTPENEFKEEHYRRIAYANENFGTNVPGWRTDRGRVYVIWGEPDSRSTPPCPNPNRTPQEGAGFEDCFPSESWHYNYLTGFGNNIDLDFVDPSGSGDYKLSVDPETKDGVTNIPEANHSRTPPEEGEGSVQLVVRGFVAPPTRFKTLSALVSARIVRHQIPINYRFDFLRGTGFTTLCSLSVEIPLRDLDPKDENSAQSGGVELFARISLPNDRVVETLEDFIPKPSGGSAGLDPEHNALHYQRTIPLPPGDYHVDIAVMEVSTGKVATARSWLKVPSFGNNSLSTSPLILTDEPELAQMHSPSTFGAYRLEPFVNLEFPLYWEIDVFLQVYGLKADNSSGRVSARVSYRIMQNEKQVWSVDDGLDPAGRMNEQETFQHKFPLTFLKPGTYTLVAEITDFVAHETISQSAEFKVLQAPR
jgi:GWxTD domain-containing protein